LKARKEFKDRNGVFRKAGEEWLVRTEGAYLPGTLPLNNTVTHNS
jgi:hypothetical protein